MLHVTPNTGTQENTVSYNLVDSLIYIPFYLPRSLHPRTKQKHVWTASLLSLSPSPAPPTSLRSNKHLQNPIGFIVCTASSAGSASISPPITPSVIRPVAPTSADSNSQHSLVTTARAAR